MQSKLERYKLFHRLSQTECALIERQGEWVRARQGQTLIVERRPNEAVYIVDQGRVDVRLSDSVGTTIDLASLGPGMMVGEYSLIDSLPAAASAVAASDAILFRIRHAKLNELLEANDRAGRIVYRNLLGILVERLRAANAELDLFNA